MKKTDVSNGTIKNYFSCHINCQIYHHIRERYGFSKKTSEIYIYIYIFITKLKWHMRFYQPKTSPSSLPKISLSLSLSLSFISHHQPKSLIMDSRVKNCFGWNVKKVWVEKNLFRMARSYRNIVCSIGPWKAYTVTPQIKTGRCYSILIFSRT